MSQQSERTARLNQLITTTTEWADKRTQQYTMQVATCKALLKGHTGTERLAQSAVQAGSALVASAISDFLSF